jgi:uncharacterized membrane protein YjjP (DUF1212 family)
MKITIERVSRLEQKVTCMDSRLGLVEQDLRALDKKMDTHFYWMLTAMAVIVGLLAKGFKWL